ncbi:MAG: CapA family protein [Beutenbergiaceae bacterium]
MRSLPAAAPGLVGILLLALLGCTNTTPEPVPETATQSTSQPSPTEPAPEEATFTIGGVGDVLPHTTPIQIAAQDGGEGGYDFRPMLEATRPYLSGVDLMLCNMEVPLALPDEAPAGHPLFAAPTELAANLADLGVDGCSTGTNHALDRGVDNTWYTLDVFDEVGLGHAGSARSQVEADTAQQYQLERGGQVITVAQIGGTFGTNDLVIPADTPYVVDVLDPDQLIAQARAARSAGADLVIATLHWGDEFSVAVSSAQQELAQQLAQSGQVDLVIGSHPHVPQPYALLDGGPDGTGMWVAWSLGNFLSNQDSACCRSETATGLFLTAQVRKPVDGPARVTGMSWTPVTVDRLGQQRVYPLLDLLTQQPEGLTLAPETLTQRLAEVEAIMAESTGAEFDMSTSPSVPTGEEPLVLPRS